MIIDGKDAWVDKEYRYLSPPKWSQNQPVNTYEDWCKANLPYICITTKQYHLHPTDNLLVCDWIRDNCQGYWTRSLRDVQASKYMFELRNDAILFKLKWG